jgi:hypothetical protein
MNLEHFEVLFNQWEITFPGKEDDKVPSPKQTPKRNDIFK